MAPAIPLDMLIRVKVGRVLSIDIVTNRARVKFSEVGGDEYDCFIACHPHLCAGDQTPTVAADKIPAWGAMAFPSVNSWVLVYEIQSQIAFIIATMPPRLGYDLWNENNKLNMNRLPIATADKRAEDIDKGVSDDLLKWGEILLRSSGLGDVYIDYKGNIVLDTSTQVTIRIGTRDADNKITSPDTEVSFGKILTTGGAEKTYSSKKVKVEIIYKNAFIRILDDGQVNVNGNLTVDV